MPVYLIAAYAVFWGVTFVLVVSLWVRQRRLERELAKLAEQIEPREREPSAHPREDA